LIEFPPLWACRFFDWIARKTNPLMCDICCVFIRTYVHHIRYGRHCCSVAAHEEALQRESALRGHALRKWKALGSTDNAVLRASARGQQLLHGKNAPGAAAQLLGEQAVALAKQGVGEVLQQLKKLQNSQLVGAARKWLGDKAAEVAGKARRACTRAAQCVKGMFGEDKDPYRRPKDRTPVPVVPELPVLQVGWLGSLTSPVCPSPRPLSLCLPLPLRLPPCLPACLPPSLSRNPPPAPLCPPSSRSLVSKSFS
jgi:hypothetical protein